MDAKLDQFYTKDGRYLIALFATSSEFYIRQTIPGSLTRGRHVDFANEAEARERFESIRTKHGGAEMTETCKNCKKRIVLQDGAWVHPSQIYVSNGGNTYCGRDHLYKTAEPTIR